MRPEEIKAPKEKFALVNENKKLHDKELVTKPVGFFKDAMYRFSRNKGSIFGAAVIGILVLYAIIAPIFSPYTVSYNDAYYKFTLPKLFNSEKIDFLDGASKKTLNETSFLYYYSMGAETGHNAIKRQEYSVDGNGMYTFRLDSYQSPGCIFLTGVTADRYQSIQAYQDETGRQVIYPITDPDKRPTQPQDVTDANYWFETTADGSRTVPTNYKYNEDGSVTFTNIYSAYKVPQLAASRNDKPAELKAVSLGDGKYSFIVCTYISDVDEEGVIIGSSLHERGYLTPERFEDTDYFVYNNVKEDAAVFTLDPTYNTLVINFSGHQDASKDGDYYLALPSGQGATFSARKLADIDSEDYNPANLFDGNADVVTSINDGEYYKFGTQKVYENNIISYFGGLTADGLTVTSTKNNAAKVRFTASGDKYTMKVFDSTGKIGSNLQVKVVDDVPTFTIGTPSEWSFNAEYSALSITLDSFTDASKNGEYYLATVIEQESEKSFTSSLELAKLEDVINDDNKDFYKVVDNDLNPVSEITPNTAYRMRSFTEFKTYSYFLSNGFFTGDNYTSRMRVEGNNNFLYSYAIEKSGHSYELRVNYYEYYCYYHSAVLHDRIDQPYFLFGTTSYGQDIFTCLASGARFSFILAIVVALVNMVVGAIYGAVEGYYGGKIDLVMERIVEILSAVPFMIVITLLKYHMGGTSHALLLFIAFFLTGWIGMSGVVRMQFYRFKNQEYVLASRTLGANDWRIMFKHIFPNALGTIVTSSVLVIPGMIFSETSLSYLGIINLNSGSMTSVGTLLANAQPFLVTYPHMILFPSIFISLLMLCFNLFGNGLRDAFNPSLRGTED